MAILVSFFDKTSFLWVSNATFKSIQILNIGKYLHCIIYAKEVIHIQVDTNLNGYPLCFDCQHVAGI